MTWEEIAALGSIASAVILAIGSVAAVVQLRHARLSNQLEGYLTLYRQSTSSNESYLRRLRSHPRAFRGILDVDTFEPAEVTAAEGRPPTPSEPSPQ